LIQPVDLLNGPASYYKQDVLTGAGGFTSLATIFAVRIPLIPVAPFPFGAQPAEPAYIAAFNLLLFFHTLVLAVLLVAMSKEREELTQRTKAQTDSLTGALNRRAFMSRGERLLRRHGVEQKPLCLLFLDLDHFKSLNDRFGHSGGDDVLMKFVAVVHDSIRPTDFLFRIGGEEFCCLLPHTSVTHAVRVAERVRQQFEAATIEAAGMPVKGTVSLGIASTEVFGYDLDTLIPAPSAGARRSTTLTLANGVVRRIEPDERFGPAPGVEEIDLAGAVVTAGFWNPMCT
jgi:diguanylate cyclase (GGDEF)-like protein